MSGGVDSSTCALMLQEQGYEVVGVTCIFMECESTDAAIHDARAVANVLGIEHHVYDCAQTFHDEVIQPFVDVYEEGATPSPCVRCNATCKIPSLMAAADTYDCQWVATGHYARVVECDGRWAIAPSLSHKDQSYMLSLLTQEQLSRLMLPLESYSKDEVRSMAAAANLPVAHKADSQDICFISGSHVDFLLENGLDNKPGNFVTKDGKVLGTHEGIFRYTLGQRKGIGIGGAPEPYYVIGKCAKTCEVMVGFARDAFMKEALVTKTSWQALSLERITELAETGEGLRADVKLRYRQQALACTVYFTVEDDSVSARVVLDDPVTVTSPGQYAVFYGDDILYGGGVIEDVVMA